MSKTAAETVTVACKLPHGLILEVMGPGGRMRHKINGARLPVGADGLPIAKFETASTFGLTTGVPKDLWDQWEAENKAYQPYAKGLIFSQGSVNSARDMAADLAELRTGLEPLTPGATKVDGKTVEPVAATTH